jgi:serine/threonine protein kinase
LPGIIRIIWANDYATAIFKWVRGELISKGTYSEVSFALKVTTGELIAVKQVETPRTGHDSSQVTAVKALKLKLESEILEGLNHQSVVQYLGFEETSRHLTMFVVVSSPSHTIDGGFIASLNMFRVVRLLTP